MSFQMHWYHCCLMALQPSKAFHIARFQAVKRLLLKISIVGFLLPSAQAQTAKKIVGYYYGKGRPHYLLSDVPVQKLTHLIYSLAWPTSQGDCELSHPDIDVPNLRSLSA